MGYPVKAVANALLKVAEEHGARVSPLKLQKLVYITHGWNLGLAGEPLVEDELPEAWEYGPVFPSLYHEFKDLGSQGIARKATEVTVRAGKLESIKPSIPKSDEFTWALVRRVWDQYGKYGAMALSDLTHREGTPWDATRKRSAYRNADISNDLIKHHYEELRTNRNAKRGKAKAR